MLRWMLAISLGCGGLFFVDELAVAARLQAADPADDDDNPLARRTGVIAKYQTPGMEFVRVDELPALRLAAGEAPDPRLPAQGWSVAWRGVIEVRSPGSYRFYATGTGELSLTVAGRSVVRGGLGKQSPPGQAVELGFGLHDFIAEYRPGPDSAALSIEWESAEFAREPLPAHALGHRLQEAAVEDRFTRGRLQVEEFGCAACHRPSKDAPISLQLETRRGPRLSEAGRRIRPGWIYHWLGNPQALRPEAVMPRLFGAGRAGDVERYAVTVALVGDDQIPPGRPLSPERRAADAEAGRKLFLTTGCVVCHAAGGGEQKAFDGTAPANGARSTLQYLGQKCTPEWLADFVRTPHETDPGGRMPGFDLPEAQAFELGIYLVEHDRAASPNLELPAEPTQAEIEALWARTGGGAPPPPTARAQLVAAGRRLLRLKSCTACHDYGRTEEFAPVGAAADFAAMASKLGEAAGCLAPPTNDDEPGPSGKIPVYSPRLDRSAAAEFVRGARSVPATPAPGADAARALARFNCLGCHDRNGRGGLGNELAAQLAALQTEENAEAVLPPSLTGITHKLIGPALQGVLKENKRVRPWMALKMPMFRPEHLEKLPQGLAALDGAVLQEKPFRPAVDLNLANAGRTLAGEKGFACFKCHDFTGLASGGTRGPDLTLVSERLTYSWYERWMTDPQRVQPGTRMPTIYLNGRSQYAAVLDGDPHAQNQALWHYLLNAKKMPFPEGLLPREPVLMAESKKPLVFRTFLPGTTPRAMAIRFPNGVHAAYDAQACRLAYGWTGEFLDTGPVWGGRGGNPAGVKGPVFWTAPEGFPWEVNGSPADVPDFSARGKDTSLGAVLPYDGQLHPTRLHFRGYRLTDAGPQFRFELERDGARIAFAEEIRSLNSAEGNGVERTATIEAAAGQLAWLHVTHVDGVPSWQPADGARTEMAEGEPVPAEAAIEAALDGKPLRLQTAAASEGSVWLLSRQGDRLSLLLRIPALGEPARARATVRLWRPHPQGGVSGK